MSAVMTDVSTGMVEKGISHDSRIYLSPVKSLKKRMDNKVLLVFNSSMFLNSRALRIDEIDNNHVPHGVREFVH